MLKLAAERLCTHIGNGILVMTTVGFGSGLPCSVCGPSAQWRAVTHAPDTAVPFSSSVNFTKRVEALVVFGGAETALFVQVYFSTEDYGMHGSEIFAWDMTKQLPPCHKCAWTSPSKQDIIDFVRRLCTETNCVIGFDSVYLEGEDIVAVNLKTNASMLKVLQRKDGNLQEVPEIRDAAKLLCVPHHETQYRANDAFDNMFCSRVLLYEIMKHESVFHLWYRCIADPEHGSVNLIRACTFSTRYQLCMVLCTGAPYKSPRLSQLAVAQALGSS